MFLTIMYCADICRCGPTVPTTTIDDFQLNRHQLTSSVAPVPNFPSKWNASIVFKCLKVEPSNPWRRSYFVWQPLILLFTSLSVPLCLVEPPLRPLVTVLWVIPSALGCLSNIQDSEGQPGAAASQSLKWSALHARCELFSNDRRVV